MNRLCFIVSLTLVSAALAQTPKVDQKAEDLLRKMCATIGAASQFTFEATNTLDEVDAEGQVIQYSKHLQMSVSRPGSLRAEVVGDRETYTAIDDGQRFTFIDPTRNIYASFPAEPTIDAAVTQLSRQHNIVAPLSNFLFSNPYSSLASAVQSGAAIGASVVDGVKCDHLAFRQADVDWQIWVEQTDLALPRKLVIIYKNKPGCPQFAAHLDKWNMYASLGNDSFRFTPPSGASERPITEVVPTTRPSVSVNRP